jgi:hypothetical protein
LGQALQLDPRLLGIFLQKNLTLLDLSLFYIFYARKKKLTRGYALFLFLFKPFIMDFTVQSTVKKLMPLVFFWIFLIIFLNLLS